MTEIRDDLIFLFEQLINGSINNYTVQRSKVIIIVNAIRAKQSVQHLIAAKNATISHGKSIRSMQIQRVIFYDAIVEKTDRKSCEKSSGH